MKGGDFPAADAISEVIQQLEKQVRICIGFAWQQKGKQEGQAKFK